MKKGRTKFTEDEISEIKSLVSKLEKADRNQQKVIRGKIRRIGLYWSEIAYSKEEYTVHNLQKYLNNSTIKVENNSDLIKRPTCAKQQSTLKEKENFLSPMDANQIEMELIKGQFLNVNSIQEEFIPDEPGLYCIKLKEGIGFEKVFGEIRKDRIIYIGKASHSLRERLWKEELNHLSPATFFRSIGAMLGYLPEKGSLYGKTTRNYVFNDCDTNSIRNWMKESLMINCIPLPKHLVDSNEKKLIEKYMPLVNIQNNPMASEEIRLVRKTCIEYAKSQKG